MTGNVTELGSVKEALVRMLRDLELGGLSTRHSPREVLDVLDAQIEGHLRSAAILLTLRHQTVVENAD